MPPSKKDKSGPSYQLLSEDPTSSEYQYKPKLILCDSEDSDSGDTQEYHSATERPDGEDGPELRINKEYARRFEHNKKREELHRLLEKYGKQGLEEEEEEEEEEEDDTAVLATERLDQEIAATIKAIQNKDPKIYDGKTTFFSTVEGEEGGGGNGGIEDVKEKPMFLKDYHRKNLLSKNIGDEDAPMTYLQEQEDLKRTVVLEMHQAAENEPGSDADDAGAGFLVRKIQPETPEHIVDIPDPATADPKNPEEYLTRFFQSRAWTKPVEFTPLQDDDSEEEDRIEEFEKAYNFRFEDPDANTRGKLVTYGRDAISANTVRREETSGRKKAREKKREKQRAEKELREKEKGRLRKLKTDKLMEKFKMIQEAAGLDDDGADDGADDGVETEVLNNLLEGDWSDEQWGEWMAKKFGNSYYAADVGKIKKPTFDDEIDIGDIVSDPEGDVKLDLENEEAESRTSEGGDEFNKDSQTTKKSKDEKFLQKEERSKKQKERDLKRKLEQHVEENYSFEDQIPSKSLKTTFRYRETTPESYGLTSLDILAAEDADLNSFVGLKKLATFREPKKKKRDKKRYGKKKRLREWRKETFGDEEGVKMLADWKPTGITGRGESGVDIREGEGGERKKRRRKGNKS